MKISIEFGYESDIIDEINDAFEDYPGIDYVILPRGTAPGGWPEVQLEGDYDDLKAWLVEHYNPGTTEEEGIENAEEILGPVR